MPDFLFRRNDLVRLASKLRWVEARHFLEFVGLASGIKRAIRIPVNPTTEAPYLAEFAGFYSLSMQLSVRKMAVVATNALGEEYVDWVDVDDPKPGDRIAYIALDRHVAESAALAEEHGDQERLGLILGYPLCCIHSYSTSERPEAWIERLTTSLPAGDRGFWQCNRIAYALVNCAATPDYFPCSLRCEETRKLGNAYAIAMRSGGFANEACKAERMMRSALFLKDDRITMLPQQRVVATTFNNIPARVSLQWISAANFATNARVIEFE